MQSPNKYIYMPDSLYCDLVSAFRDVPEGVNCKVEGPYIYRWFKDRKGNLIEDAETLSNGIKYRRITPYGGNSNEI